MAWEIQYRETAASQLRKLDEQVAQRILDDMERRVASLGDPRAVGKGLRGPLAGFWWYRSGDCRVACELQNQGALVLVVWIGNRRDVLARLGLTERRQTR